MNQPVYGWPNPAAVPPAPAQPAPAMPHPGVTYPVAPPQAPPAGQPPVAPQPHLAPAYAPPQGHPMAPTPGYPTGGPAATPGYVPQPAPPQQQQQENRFRVLLRHVRISYPALVEPTSFEEGQTKKYKAAFIWGLEEEFGQENMQAITQAVNLLKHEFWQGQPVYIVDQRKCLRDGNTMLDQRGQLRPEMAGKWVLSAKSAQRPNCFDRNRNLLEPQDIPRVIYAGSRVDAFVTFYGIKDPKRGGNGLFAALDAVRFRKDDDPFGAAPVGGDAFDELPPLPGQPYQGAAAPYPGMPGQPAPGQVMGGPPAGGWGNAPF